MGENQQDLVSLLYSVHDKLRLKRRQTKDDPHEWQEAWRQHTEDLSTLQEYSKAMHDLATKIWEPRNTVSGEEDDNLSASGSNCQSGKLKCRLEWVARCCRDYFKCRLEGEGGKLSLLDVGSCYNPFSKYSSYFDIVAVDLCPAPGFEESIFQCDFLEVGLIKKEESGNSNEAIIGCIRSGGTVKDGKYSVIRDLPKNCFDVVVFSYFLEYLADAKQREESCRKAHQLLRENGLLFILRPDSSRVTPGGNNVLIKKMKVGMGALGFKRVYFEKLEHLWCMAFKKLNEEERCALLQSSYFRTDVRKVGVEFSLEESDRIHELFCISQDFKEYPEAEECTNSGKSDAELTAESSNCNQSLLDELPNFEVSF